MRNIEIKARLVDFSAALCVAARLATADLGTLIQRDTYFRCLTGRLKLREINSDQAQLIQHQRSNEANPRPSDYTVLELIAAEPLKSMLSSTLSILTVVEKTRRLFIYEGVRIHLDQVKELGDFLELEAVLTDNLDESTAQHRIQWLLEQFGITQSDYCQFSYSDMISNSTG
ncbi:MAG: class IV adenylate cyclase [Planctomycetota bacterium]|nr:class IV adenylate cyclase [Planctomycetota bacterium]